MDSVVLEVERRLRVGTAEARAMLVRSLRAQEFTVTGEQVATVTAKRGSQLIGSVQPKKLPIHLRVVLQPDPAGCVVRIRLADAWRSAVGRVWGMNGPYRSVLSQVQHELDAVLRPVAADGADFTPVDVETATADIALLSRSNDVLGQAGGVAADRVGDLLDHQPSPTPRALQEVVLRGPAGVASFDRQGVQGLLTVTLLISRSPGAMPPNLARDVEAFSARLEAAIAAHPRGRLDIAVSEAEVPVVEFVAKQAELRSRLPMRTLQTCTTCKLERVVNPDFKRLQDHNRRKQVLTGAVGATVSAKGVNPFFLVGSLLRLKSSEIEFVCPRCQGLDADTTVVTFCPQCGDRRGEAVLRKCPRCTHGFAAVLGATEPLWQAEPLPAPVPGPGPAPGMRPAPGPLAPRWPAPAAGQEPALELWPGPGPLPAQGAVVDDPPGADVLPTTHSARPTGDPAPTDGAASPGDAAPAGAERAAAAAAPPDLLPGRAAATGQHAPARTPSGPATLTSGPPAPPPPKPAAGARVGAAEPTPVTPAGPPPSHAVPDGPQPTPAVPAGRPGTGAAGPPPGWFPDPSGRHRQRHWDGELWTPFVLDGDAHGYDPL